MERLLRNDLRSLLIDQVLAAQERHPSLQLKHHGETEFQILGRIGVRGERRGESIEGEYDLTMIVPAVYPDRPPKVYDPWKQIPEVFEHVNLPTRELCLGAPVAVNRLFSQSRTLLHFLERQVEPFLLGASCAARFGISGFHELAHGGRGLLDYYAQRFSCDDAAAVNFVALLANSDAPSDVECPCGSGKWVKHCHGPKLEALRPHRTASEFGRELLWLRVAAMESALASYLRHEDRGRSSDSQS